MADLKKFSLLFILGLLLLLSGCATVYNPATGAKEYISIGTQEEVSIGKEVAAAVEAKYKLSQNTAQIERVNSIGRRIAAVSDRQDLKYHFKVLENKDINALSTPGGYVYVNTGLLDKADDDELAAVIGHEVGHIAARHAVQAIDANKWISGGMILATILIKSDNKKAVMEGASMALDVIMKGYSREDEFEADKLGVRYAYYAGFDPNGAVTFMEKLRQAGKDDRIAVYFSTHPLYSERIAKARAYAAYLKEMHSQPPVYPPKPAKQQ